MRVLRHINYKPLFIWLAIAGFLYLVLLSSGGLITRQNLIHKREKLERLTERLKEKQARLEQKARLMKNDDVALRAAAKKYLLLNENSHILRFLEPDGSEAAKPEPLLSEDDVSLWAKYLSIDTDRLAQWRKIFLALCLIITGILMWRLIKKAQNLAGPI